MGSGNRKKIPGNAHRRKSPTTNPDATRTTCVKCNATIAISEEESVMEAVLDHFRAAHDL